MDNQMDQEIVYVALYDYTARTSEDLSFQTGDQFQVLDQINQYWWHARALTGASAYCMGYIPANYVAPLESLDAQPWFFPDTKRSEAERLLLTGGNQNAAFLIRDSESQPGKLSLSVLNGRTVDHYLINNLEGGQYSINPSEIFSTLTELVMYYSKPGNQLQIELQQPCQKVIVPQTTGLSYDMVEQWEVPRDSIELLEKIGSGNFGNVYRGLWNGTTPVAVKTAKPDIVDRGEFLREAQIMKKLLHPKLIQLYAVCTVGEPIYIITELMKHGSLLEYLRQDRGQTLGMADQVGMAVQVAEGMAYLEQKNYIHRDLAARNVLVGGNNTCKVADFGLSRVFTTPVEDEGVYEVRRGVPIPIKWSAPEVFDRRIFTIKSDVWSFGVLLYEVMTWGQEPYGGFMNREVTELVCSGYRMDRPGTCPDSLYDLMMKCWEEGPHDRPTFKSLKRTLDDLYQ